MFLLTIFGLFMAIVANMSGVEGGVIFVPLFILIFQLSPQEAAGVSMATMVFGLGAGSLAYARQRRIDFRLGGVLLIATLPGTILGAMLTPYLSSGVLETVLGLLLIPLGFLLMHRRKLQSGIHALDKAQSGWRRVWRDSTGQEIGYTVRRISAGLPVYFIIGFLAGLLGIGGGAFLVPAFILLLGGTPHVAVATSVFMMAIIALTGALIHGAVGNIRLDYVLYLIPGVLVGSQIGAWLAAKTTATFLMKILRVFLVLTGFAVIAKGFGLLGG